MHTVVSTAPSYLPVSLTDLKNHLKISGSSEDDLLNIYLGAATEMAQTLTRRYFMKQTLKVYMDDWAVNMILYGVGPVQSITSIEYLDEDGATQTLATSEYKIDISSDNPRIVLIDEIPTLQDDTLNRVIITIEAGYSSSATESTQQAAVPTPIRSAILLQAARLYETREDKMVQVGWSRASEQLLIPYKVCL